MVQWLKALHPRCVNTERPVVQFQCFVVEVHALTSTPVLQIETLTTFLPAAARLVAIGDLHGDMGKTRRAFRIAGLIDANDRWTGGTTTAVQVNSCITLCTQRKQGQLLVILLNIRCLALLDTCLAP